MTAPATARAPDDDTVAYHDDSVIYELAGDVTVSYDSVRWRRDRMRGAEP